MAPVPPINDPPRATVTWSSRREAVAVLARPAHLQQTALTALIVGTILFLINHLDTVLAGVATIQTWIKIVVTYLVPFIVANIGLLLGSRRPRSPDPRSRRRRG